MLLTFVLAFAVLTVSASAYGEITSGGTVGENTAFSVRADYDYCSADDHPTVEAFMESHYDDVIDNDNNTHIYIGNTLTTELKWIVDGNGYDAWATVTNYCDHTEDAAHANVHDFIAAHLLNTVNNSATNRAASKVFLVSGSSGDYYSQVVSGTGFEIWATEGCSDTHTSVSSYLDTHGSVLEDRHAMIFITGDSAAEDDVHLVNMAHGDKANYYLTGGTLVIKEPAGSVSNVYATGGNLLVLSGEVHVKGTFDKLATADDAAVLLDGDTVIKNTGIEYFGNDYIDANVKKGSDAYSLTVEQTYSETSGSVTTTGAVTLVKTEGTSATTPDFKSVTVGFAGTTEEPVLPATEATVYIGNVFITNKDADTTVGREVFGVGTALNVVNGTVKNAETMTGTGAYTGASAITGSKSAMHVTTGTVELYGVTFQDTELCSGRTANSDEAYNGIVDIVTSVADGEPANVTLTNCHIITEGKMTVDYDSTVDAQGLYVKNKQAVVKMVGTGTSTMTSSIKGGKNGFTQDDDTNLTYVNRAVYIYYGSEGADVTLTNVDIDLYSSGFGECIVQRSGKLTLDGCTTVNVIEGGSVDKCYSRGADYAIDMDGNSELIVKDTAKLFGKKAAIHSTGYASSTITIEGNVQLGQKGPVSTEDTDSSPRALKGIWMERDGVGEGNTGTLTVKNSVNETGEITGTPKIYASEIGIYAKNATQVTVENAEIYVDNVAELSTEDDADNNVYGIYAYGSNVTVKDGKIAVNSKNLHARGIYFEDTADSKTKVLNLGTEHVDAHVVEDNPATGDVDESENSTPEIPATGVKIDVVSTDGQAAGIYVNGAKSVTVIGAYAGTDDYADGITVTSTNESAAGIVLKNVTQPSSITDEKIVVTGANGEGDATYGVAVSNCNAVSLKGKSLVDVSLCENNAYVYGVYAKESWVKLNEDVDVKVQNGGAYTGSHYFGVYVDDLGGGNNATVDLLGDVEVVSTTNNMEVIGVETTKDAWLRFSNGEITVTGDKVNETVGVRNAGTTAFTGGKITLVTAHSTGVVNTGTGTFTMGTEGQSELPTTAGEGYPLINAPLTGSSNMIGVKNTGKAKFYAGAIKVAGNNAVAISAEDGTTSVLANKAVRNSINTLTKYVFFAEANRASGIAFQAQNTAKWEIRGTGALFVGDKALNVWETTEPTVANGSLVSGGTFVGVMQMLNNNGTALSATETIEDQLATNHYIRKSAASYDGTPSAAWLKPTEGYTADSFVTAWDVEEEHKELNTAKNVFTVVDAEWELRYALEYDEGIDDLVDNYVMPCNIILDANSKDEVSGIFHGAMPKNGDVDVDKEAFARNEETGAIVFEISETAQTEYIEKVTAYNAYQTALDTFTNVTYYQWLLARAEWYNTNHNLDGFETAHPEPVFDDSIYTQKVMPEALSPDAAVRGEAHVLDVNGKTLSYPGTTDTKVLHLSATGDLLTYTSVAGGKIEYTGENGQAAYIEAGLLTNGEAAPATNGAALFGTNEYTVYLVGGKYIQNSGTVGTETQKTATGIMLAGGSPEVVINDGTVFGSTDGIRNHTTGTVTVNNGTITGGTNGINQDVAGTTTVNGGTIKGNGTIAADDLETANVNEANAGIKATAGTLVVTPAAAVPADETAGTPEISATPVTITGAANGIYATGMTKVTVDSINADLTITGSAADGVNVKANTVTMTLTDKAEITGAQNGIVAVDNNWSEENADTRDSVITVDGATIAGVFCGLWANDINEVTVSDTVADHPTISGGMHGLWIDDHSIATVNSGKIVSTGDNGVGVDVDTEAKLTVKGGTITAAGANGKGISSSGDATVTGGTITAAYGIFAIGETSKLTVKPAAKVEANPSAEPPVEAADATPVTITGTLYGIATHTSGIESVTIDSTNAKLTVKGTAGDGINVKANTVTMTLTDKATVIGAINGIVAEDCDDTNDSTASSTITVNGAVVIGAKNYDVLEDLEPYAIVWVGIGNNTTGADGINVGSTVTLNVSGDAIVAGKMDGIETAGTTTITGGEITGGTNGINVAASGTATVSGGKVNGATGILTAGTTTITAVADDPDTAENEATSPVITGTTDALKVTNGTANISGGTFNGNVTNEGNTADTGATTITGGSFPGDNGKTGDDKVIYTMTVSGGAVEVKNPVVGDDETPVAPTIGRDITVSGGSLTVTNGTVNGTVTKTAASTVCLKAGTKYKGLVNGVEGQKLIAMLDRNLPATELSYVTAIVKDGGAEVLEAQGYLTTNNSAAAETGYLVLIHDSVNELTLTSSGITNGSGAVTAYEANTSVTLDYIALKNAQNGFSFKLTPAIGDTVDSTHRQINWTVTAGSGITVKDKDGNVTTSTYEDAPVTITVPNTLIGGTYKVTATAVDATNSKVAEFTITVTPTNLDNAVFTLDKTYFQYDEAEHTVQVKDITVKVNGKPYTVKQTDGDYTVTDTLTNTATGQYTVTVSGAENKTTLTATRDLYWEIREALLTLTVHNKTVSSGYAVTATDIEALASVSNLPEGITAEYNYTVPGTECTNGDAAAAATALGTITGTKTVQIHATLSGTNAANYGVSNNNATATISLASTGGGGGFVPTPTYTIKCGTGVKADVEEATAGKTITLTVSEGYEKIVVTDDSGKAVTVTGNTFKMPASDVKVTVSAIVKEPETITYDKCLKDSDCVLTAFNDIEPAKWYHDGIHYCLDNGMMNGLGNGKFGPFESTTRAMIFTILARLDGQTITSTGANWYADGQAWAVKSGVSDGTNPTANITREQLAAMLYRYATLKGYDVSASGELTTFGDYTSVSSYAVEAMQWAVGAGIITGNNGNLKPTDGATRAEVATMLMRFCELIVK